jgi:hypothetical protein
VTVLHLDKNPAAIPTSGIKEGANRFDRSTVAADDPAQILGIYADAEKGTSVIPCLLDVYLVGMSDQTTKNELEKISHEKSELT